LAKIQRDARAVANSSRVRIFPSMPLQMVEFNQLASHALQLWQELEQKKIRYETPKFNAIPS
jgi:hypothetical protein